ncbi:uncharacterized protein METZ01_LOCUS66602 [marine metagenome]|uniref:Uncharacterized protein n=1 Tax=marine metagenome TaxID=408172 RepID=A0A381TDU8_9ZZZZ
MSTEQEFASDLRVDFLELISASGQVIDLSQNFVLMNIYEDLFRANMTCDLVLNDSINMPYKIPILGEEYLNFTLTSKSVDGSEEYAGPMYITSISKRTVVKERQQIYMIHGTSECGMVNQNMRVNQAFRGKKISEIVDTILIDYIDYGGVGNDFVVEDTVGIENIVIPNWRPHAAIHWLCKRAINKNKVPNYLFWESNGVSYFKSVDALLDTPVKHKFLFSPTGSKSQKVEQLAQGRALLDDLQILKQFNTLQNITNGMYASKLITHDIVRKTINQQTYGLQEAYDPHVHHTDKYMPISMSDTDYEVPERNTYAPQDDIQDVNSGDSLQTYFDSRVIFHPKHNQMYAKNVNDFYDNGVERWRLKRNALIQSLDQIKLKIEFPGLPFLHVGDTIDLLVPSGERVVEQKPGMIKNQDDLIDKFLSGVYIITALKHTYDWNAGRLKYTMVAEITKDALASAPRKV